MTLALVMDLEYLPTKAMVLLNAMASTGMSMSRRMVPSGYQSRTVALPKAAPLAQMAALLGLNLSFPAPFGNRKAPTLRSQSIAIAPFTTLTLIMTQCRQLTRPKGMRTSRSAIGIRITLLPGRMMSILEGLMAS